MLKCSCLAKKKDLFAQHCKSGWRTIWQFYDLAARKAELFYIDLLLGISDSGPSLVMSPNHKITNCTCVIKTWAMAVAQLVERWFLTPDIRDLNPKIGKILSTNCTIK